MIKRILSGISILQLVIAGAIAQTLAPVSYGPVPSENQLRWQAMEYYAFVHFSLNTYTDQSWGFGNEDINLFNPTETGLSSMGSYL